VLQRTVRPLTAIEQQLHGLAIAPSPADVELKPVKAATSAAVGWNRLAERCELARKTSGLESRLTEALEGFRQRKADQILNSLPDGVALTDDRGRVTLANQATVALLALAGDNSDPRGKAMEELLELEPGTEPGRQFLDFDSRARTVVAEVNRSGDGSQGLLRVARHPIRGAKGNLGAGHIWSIRDITQQKLAEQMRNQFVNSATHEIRTPLANIKAYAETLSLSDVDIDKQKEFCNTINAEATRLARLIDDLLSISSMEVGALSLAKTETDVDRLLHEVMDKVRPQMVKKHITLHASLPEKLPKLKLDKDKISATLVNLLGNAAKYTPEGGQVHFKAQVKQDVLQIDVEDTGFGISAEELPKVFDKFFRSSDPRVQNETGSGLGLSLVQEVIRLHGGKLGVQSELNKGTRFTVTLPLG
jgi:two-component system phosphate regulon sensor histidine kinase PhoR